jgi:hypothetical protein
MTITDEHLCRLPSLVRDRLQSLRDISQDRRAAILRLSESRQETAALKMDAESRLAQLNQKHQGLPDDHPSLRSATEEIARHTATLARLAARNEELTPGWENAARLVERLETYILDNADRLDSCKGNPPQLQTGETAIDGIERAARRTRTLKADRQEVLASPFPSSVAKKIARAQIAERIEAARPDVVGLVEQLEPIRWPKSREAIEQRLGFSSDTVGMTAIDPVGLMGWLFQKQLLAAIDAEIDAVADDGAALSVEERIKRLAEIDGDILDSERQEAEFATLAGVLPRADIDPRAILALSDSMPGRKLTNAEKSHLAFLQNAGA